MKICFISPRGRNSLVLPVTLTLGRSAFCLLETRRFLTLGVDTDFVTLFIMRNTLTENL